MASSNLYVLVGLPRPFLETLGEEHLKRLFRTHPQVHVEIVDSLRRFLDLVPRAHAVMIYPPVQTATGRVE